MALTSLGFTGRGDQEQPGVKTRSDVEAVSREHQEKQLVELSLQKALLASLAAWERATMNCSLVEPLKDAGQAPLNSLHHVILLTLGLPPCVGTGRALGRIKNIGS